MVFMTGGNLLKAGPLEWGLTAFSMLALTETLLLLDLWHPLLRGSTEYRMS